MKNNKEKALVGIVSNPGLMVAQSYLDSNLANQFSNAPLPYDEEQDRWTFRAVEHGSKANLLSQPGNPDKVTSQAGAKFNQGLGIWMKLFGQKG